jgi:HTH-type transcriptional regulator/antitoxin HigA
VDDLTEYRTPGQYLQRLLDERGWTQRVLAIVLDVGETVVNKMAADKRPIDAAMALSLGELFGVKPEGFMQLQLSFDLDRARLVARPDPKRETRAHLFGGLPIADMIARGWLRANDVRDVKSVERALTKFFGVKATDEIEILPHAAKRTQVVGPTSPAQLAWLYRVKKIAEDMLAGPYSHSSVRTAIQKLKALLGAAEEARHVPRILAEAGIRFVVVESLPSAKIDGVCFWLNGESPVIGMSMRRDTIDNFWFVLRHELEHVGKLHGQVAAMLDADLEGERAGVGDGITEEERVANEAAAEFCVPQKSLTAFVARKAPFFAERDIIGFARTHKLHPGLVAGQLQHRTGRYDLFRSHQVKIRSIVAPGAMVDGWGDVHPSE